MTGIMTMEAIVMFLTGFVGAFVRFFLNTSTSHMVTTYFGCLLGIDFLFTFCFVLFLELEGSL